MNLTHYPYQTLTKVELKHHYQFQSVRPRKLLEREADIVCITQTTLVMINNVLLIYNGRFMLLRLEVSFDLFAYINRLDD